MSTQQPLVVDNVLTGADAHVAAWVEQKLGGDTVDVPFYAIGITGEGGALIGGAYFYNYRSGDANDICCAVAVEDGNTISRDVLRKILSYPFGQLSLPRISIEIDESNQRAIEQADIIGFKLEGRKRRAGKGGGDILLMGLLRDECKFWSEQPK